MWSTSARFGRYLTYIVAAIAVAALAVPVYIYFFSSQPNYVDTAIRKIRFFPLTPPSTLRAPGTIYVVSSDGQPTSSLCEVRSDRLKDFIHESLTETQVAQELRKASFAADAAMEKSLKAQLKADVIESVQFSLEDVSVLEVSIANLRTIASELQKDEACAASVEDYLKAGQYICQGQQSLKATSKYSIRIKRSADAEVSAQVLQDAVRATIDPKAEVDGSTVTAGVGLYYGIRLAPLCFSLPGNRPPPAPVSWRSRIMNWVRP